MVAKQTWCARASLQVTAWIRASQIAVYRLVDANPTFDYLTEHSCDPGIY